jgi:flagellar hook-length control protein FliK
VQPPASDPRAVSDQVPSPATQLLQVLTPLRSAGGVHQLVLALDPPGLGTVRAEVVVAGTALSVHLVADTAEGHQALAEALPHLEGEMAGAAHQVSVSLAHGGQRQSSPWPETARRGEAGAPGSSDSPDQGAPAGPLRPSPTSTIDLRL